MFCWGRMCILVRISPPGHVRRDVCRRWAPLSTTEGRVATAEADKTVLIPSHRAGVGIFLISTPEGRGVTAPADKTVMMALT